MNFFSQAKRLIFFVLLFDLTGCGGSSPVEGLYTAITADDVEIKIKRYRPDPRENYLNSQPIILFPSLLTNINMFETHTPKGKEWAYRRMSLPNNIASWAENDEYIADDPMVYYSLAHYLWTQGYDVWMANYRGIGRGDFASEKGNLRTNMDVWAALDVPAVIDKVMDVTGKKPVIGGHSTGGLVTYLYLQGIHMDARAAKKGDYVPHLESSEVLALERNNNIAGFLGLDPAGSPPLAYEALIDSGLVWTVLSQPWYIDLDLVVGDVIMPAVPTTLTSGAISFIFSSISNLADAFPEGLLPGYADVFGALDFWHVENMNRYTEDYIGRLGLSSMYLRTLAQYADWGINGVFREHWMNGEENSHLTVPPDAMEGDGYYYYADYMDRMTVPALSFFSSSSALVNTEVMVELIYNGKTPHPLDQWLEVSGTGHLDVVMSDNTPATMFPRIGQWLSEL
ncbi:hypothetical protein A9Q99_04835 [Gammaproteobacteria bacterium 45_16_T64]|nr:hypothetical protein A9Q99_04835 [Gammaproteobacteria bacterium 45_16_T64]